MRREIHRLVSEVLVSMALRSSGANDAVPVGHFHQLVLVEAGEITRIRVFLDGESAIAAADDA